MLKTYTIPKGKEVTKEEREIFWEDLFADQRLIPKLWTFKNHFIKYILRTIIYTR